MSEVRLVVREADRDWSGKVHGSDADRVIAALSADPLTLEELEIAVSRYCDPKHSRRLFSDLRPKLRDVPHDAGLVIIDLVARLIAVDSTYSSPGKSGAVFYHDGSCKTEIRLQYHLADDWLLTSDRNCWQVTADHRRRARHAQPRLSTREIFYGNPLLEYVARQCFSAFGRRDEIAAAVRTKWVERARQRLADEGQIPPEEVDPSLLTEEEIVPRGWPGEERYSSLYYETLKDIHASWLLTPRDDLAGRCPREVAFEECDHLRRDLEHQRQNWIRLDRCPPGLPETSQAFLNAGFGIHERVEYYELVRELLWLCWERLEQIEQSSGTGYLSVGDFLMMETPQLEMARDQWLDSADPELHDRTPRSIIDRERARLPEAVFGRRTMADPDCPCCQELAELPGPTFWHLDGCNMDDEFAFNIYHKTLQDWEKDRREWEEMSRKSDAEWSERQRLGMTDTGSGDESNSIWSKSFSISDNVDVPLGMRAFEIGCHLAEIIVDLRSNADTEETEEQIQNHIEELNRVFGNLRDLLQTADFLLSEALIEPVVTAFCEALNSVAARHSDARRKCDSLAQDVQNLLAPPRNWTQSSDESWDSVEESDIEETTTSCETWQADDTWDADNMDVPF